MEAVGAVMTRAAREVGASGTQRGGSACLHRLRKINHPSGGGGGGGMTGRLGLAVTTPAIDFGLVV